MFFFDRRNVAFRSKVNQVLKTRFFLKWLLLASGTRFGVLDLLGTYGKNCFLTAKKISFLSREIICATVIIIQPFSEVCRAICPNIAQG